MKNRDTEEKKVVTGIEIILCLMAFFLARLGIEGGYYTVGVAYIGSLFFSKIVKRWAWLFACCGIVALQTFHIDTLKYIVIIVLVVTSRYVLEQMGKKLTLANQTISVGASFFVVNSMVSVIQGSNVYYSILNVLEAFGAMALCYLMSFSIGIIATKRQTPLTKKEGISMIFFFTCIIGSVVDFYVRVPVFTTIYFKDIAVMLLMVAITYLGGINLGVTVSIVLSTVLVMMGYITADQVGVYAMAALFGGIFQPIGRIGVILGIGMGQVLGFIIFNQTTIDLPLLGSFIVGGVLSLVLPKNYFGMIHWFQKEHMQAQERQHLFRIQALITERLKSIVNGFKKLEKSLKSMEKNYLDYTPKALNAIIEESAEELCTRCSMKHFCWEQDLKNTYDDAYKMVAALEKKGRLKNGDLPERFKAHCLQSENFAYILGHKLDLLKQELTWQNKFIENKALVAEELGAVALTLENLIHEVEQDMYFNKEEEEKIKEALGAEGIQYDDVVVIEKRGRTYRISIYTQEEVFHQSGEVFKAIIYKSIGYHVSLEKCQHTQEGYHYQLSICNMYKIATGSAVSVKADISGDVHTFMELEDNQYLLGLADGMGSGRLAYEESSAAMEMLEDFMDSGFQKELAVRMINAALILKSREEVFSTMDITLIDRRTGVAEFLKAGASTSFILRNKEVITIKASSLPVGILKEVKVKIKKVQLEPGDIIVMVTDGILENQEDVLGKEETFKHFIKEVETRDPEQMAQQLMKRCKDLLGVEEGDDMTIVVARVWQEATCSESV